MERRLTIYVDIDNTICSTPDDVHYDQSMPIQENIDKINKLYKEGHTIIYWTARGMRSKVDYTDLTKKQLEDWGCRYHELRMNEKPSYDLLICDKTKRIEEL
jgi:uncharacterized HAD superfamily protein